MCGAPGGNHPLLLCKGLTCDCPELPTLISTGDTIITPPLLNHSHYLKDHMPDMLQQLFCKARRAGFNSPQCSVFQQPCRCFVQARQSAQIRRLPAARIIRSGSLERPCGSPCLVLQQAIVSLISGRKMSSGFGNSDAMRT